MKKQILKIFSFIFIFIFILFIWVFKAIWWTEEAIKMIDYKDRLTEQWISVNYLNSISDIVVWYANNAYIDIINKYKGDISINTENTYFTQKDYKSEAITFSESIPNNTIWFIHNNNDSILTKDEIGIWLDYYAWNELAPKNPTSILPIHKPCERKVQFDKSISYINCETFVTTDSQPLFISFFENWNEFQWGWFTIVEIRNKSTEELLKRFFIWWSKIGDSTVDYVLHKSYTYWSVQTQDRSNLYIPWASGNLNLNWVKTLSYDNLALWDYTIYLQNINKFWLQSDKIKAWYLSIVPPEGALKDFDFIDITNLDTGLTKNIVWWFVSINFKKNGKVRINNPWNYEYDILTQLSWVHKSWNEFTVDEFREGDNIFNLQIKDSAWNILDNRPLVVTVDTIPPNITQISLDHTFYNKSTVDWSIAMINYLWVDHVNDNIDFNWVNWWYKTPFSVTVTDNTSLSWVVLQYSSSYSWVYDNVIDFQGSDGLYKFNIDTSFIPNDWEALLFIRAIDQFWNISKPKLISFYLNRIANKPNIVTNNWLNIITNNSNLDIKLELDIDIVKVLYDWFNMWDYQPFSTTYTANIPLTIWEKNYTFYAIDMLWNKSDWSTINILKNPLPKDWIYWQDSTIEFQWWVTTNQLNLQRKTSDWSAWEIFSR
jgi:hypothetical protein